MIERAALMDMIGNLLILALDIYIYVIIASVIISWLLVFEVINARNPQAQNLVRLLARATEPVYKPLRRYIPPIGGIDITPIVIIFGIYLLQRIIAEIFIY